MHAVNCKVSTPQRLLSVKALLHRGVTRTGFIYSIQGVNYKGLNLQRL